MTYCIYAHTCISKYIHTHTQTLIYPPPIVGDAHPHPPHTSPNIIQGIVLYYVTIVCILLNCLKFLGIHDLLMYLCVPVRLRHYTVRYRERSRKWNYQTCPTSDTVIDNLRPNAVYEFGVQPNSKDGTGVWSKPVIHNISSGGIEGMFDVSWTGYRPSHSHRTAAVWQIDNKQVSLNVNQQKSMQR